MSNILIKRKKTFLIDNKNPYRTRTLIIEGRLTSRNKIEIKVQQVDWTLKNKVDDKEVKYVIESEYDYMGLINSLYKDLKHIKFFRKTVEEWVQKNKFHLYSNWPN